MHDWSVRVCIIIFNSDTQRSMAYKDTVTCTQNTLDATTLFQPENYTEPGLVQ